MLLAGNTGGRKAAQASQLASFAAYRRRLPAAITRCGRWLAAAIGEHRVSGDRVAGRRCWQIRTWRSPNVIGTGRARADGDPGDVMRWRVSSWRGQLPGRTDVRRWLEHVAQVGPRIDLQPRAGRRSFRTPRRSVHSALPKTPGFASVALLSSPIAVSCEGSGRPRVGSVRIDRGDAKRHRHFDDSLKNRDKHYYAVGHRRGQYERRSASSKRADSTRWRLDRA